MFTDEIKNLVTRFKQQKPSSNFKRWEPRLFNKLIEETDFLPKNASIRQRLWHVENNNKLIPLCKQCNTKPVSWNLINHTYRDYCGSKCMAEIKEIKEKRKKTMMNKYGVEYYTTANDFNEKRKKTSLKKYNTEWPIQFEEIRNKQKETNLQKYGTEIYVKSKDYKVKNEKTLKQFNIVSSSQKHISTNTLQRLSDKNWLIDQHHHQKKTIQKISQELNVDSTTIISRLNDFNILICRFNASQGQRDLIQEIKTFYDATIIENCRSILPSKKELDIFLPDLNIAIEFCGLYWHSSDKQTRISKNYHAEKYNECKALGIQLLTIFEDEWIDKKEIVISIIKYKLKKLKVPLINARTCIIKKISKKIADDFLNTFHIQGAGPGSIRIGLYTKKNELIAVFKVIRKSTNEFIINRYATSGIVRGGFSKLLSFFKKNYIWKKIITFADLRWSSGSLYEKTGFINDSYIKPDYQYVKDVKRYHKFNFRHSKLSKKLLNYDATKTEVENCLNSGLYRIWDCGKLRFIIENTNG